MAVIYLAWPPRRKSIGQVNFWHTLIKYCMEVVKKCPPCQFFHPKKRTNLAPLHPVIVFGPFSKWGIDFVHCSPTSAAGHSYAILVVDYFTKWVEAIPTFAEDGKTMALFIFNHIIARFGVPQAIMTDHGSHFRNHVMNEMSAKLYFRHENSTPYYPQANRQVEAINKVLK